MRALIIATGLCIAAGAATAGQQDDAASRSGANIALANGCVYAPSGQGDAWSLSHRQSGSKAHCALTVRAKVQPVSGTATSGELGSDYLVGAFR